MNEFDKLRCGILFLAAIGPDALNDFFAKVRESMGQAEVGEDVRMGGQSRQSVYPSYTLVTVETECGDRTFVTNVNKVFYRECVDRKTHNSRHHRWACKMCLESRIKLAGR
jgi:hypothetical protein